MAKRLTDKVALITGAAQGIGEGIARAMAEEGAILFLGDINQIGVERLAAELDATPLRQDTSCEADWIVAHELIRSRHGRLDILVNNAGVEFVAQMKDHSLEDWRKLMSVNVDGVFLGCKTMEPLLQAAAAGSKTASVINISSVGGLVGYPNQLAYNTSKGAVRQMTKCLAIEWTTHGHRIRANSIHPGCIRTPMLEHGVERWIATGSVPSENSWEFVASMCPMNMIGTPRDIGMAAVYLGSDESKFVTGLELVVDGGYVAR